TTLVTAAIYAGTTQNLRIEFVIAAAAAGAILGDNLGFWMGRRFGVELLEKHGHLVRIDARRIGLGQFLFDRHGGKGAVFGRFIALLRALAALLAGVNQMNWRRFLFFNAAGGIVWASVYGLAAYLFGEEIKRVQGPIAIIGIVVAVAAVIGGTWIARRHEE